ncbi:hypothetical protein ABB37_05683 [Leptomonas pyrrhocoris]|uniref:Uncharacterized protein n=1 Tax=Leptomonas pyrrhocoris TaxID=157538 RepID=A0A0M9FZ97_LEPPY|nr:hypothetical protein ABB37_05683 [Leptomonas pyrrhocoris]KPA79190.1 hypothetical protein ABB37_05683 [Leptomonas pyrrhocoris]|eukprot:XP_015657629.1 hypothetical protein ABB37_05683 [Leptomonas pyrrhocoris]
MLASALDAPSIPGVDVACNALYLSLIGEVPEAYCPPGCTLHATTQGSIYVLDHVRRIGYPLQLTQAATPEPTPQASLEGEVASAVPVSGHKRSRESSPVSHTSSSLHRGWDRRGGSPDSSMDPTARQDDDDTSLSSAVQRSPKSSGISNRPQFCLIPPRPRWLQDLYHALQLSSHWQHTPNILLYCHYCRVYFSAKPRGIWYHLSQTRGHRVQRQRIRGFMNSGIHLLDSAEKRLLYVATPEQIGSLPKKLFQHADRVQKNEEVRFVPACVCWRSVMSAEQRERVVRDGAAHAAQSITREDLNDNTPTSFVNESPQLVGWRFVMEGLDIVHCFCSKTNMRLRDYQILNHHKSDQKKD